MKICYTILLLIAIFAVAYGSYILTYTPQCDGIDVSHHNRRTNLQDGSQPKFMIAKATEGATRRDPKFNHYRNEARQKGMKFGAYHYLKTGKSAKEQFENFKNTVGKDIDIIPVLDVEQTNNKALSPKAMRRLVDEYSALCKEYYGVKPIIYCNEGYRFKYFLGSGYKMWICNWKTRPLLPCTIHQYTDNRDRLDYNCLQGDLSDILL